MYFSKFLARLFFILLLTFISAVVFAQTNKDLLLKNWQKARLEKGYRSDTANVILLNQLSEQYLYNHTDSALYFAKQALHLAEFQKFVLGQAMSWNSIGKGYYVQGDYTTSLDASAKLMKISRAINYETGIGEAYQIIALVYLAQDKNDNAIADFTRALEIFTRLNDQAKAGKVYFDLGICYDEGGRSEKAFYYLGKAIEIANSIGDKELLSMTLNRTGETYFHLKNYKKALLYYQQVIASKFTSNWEKDFAYSGVAQTYYELGVFDKAIANAQKSLTLSKKVNSAADVLRALKILSDSYAAIKDYKHAYSYQSWLKNSNDSVFNKEKENEINYLHLKRQQADNIRLENEIKAKEQAIAFSKRLLLFRNLVALVTIIFFILIIRSNRRTTALNKLLKQQNSDIESQKEEISSQKEALDKLNNTKDQLFSVISHDLRSPFTAILQTLDLIRSGDIPAEQEPVVLENFYQQINLVGLMVNNLLFWANSQQSGIKSNLMVLNLATAVNEIVSVSSFLAKHKNITLYHHYDDDKWVFADLDHVKIIVQNLIGNAIKFTPPGGSIEVYYTEDENHYIVHVKDNGVGISPEKMAKLFKVTGREISAYGTNNEGGAGIGLALIKQFVDANDGQMEVKSVPGSGSEFSVYFKKA